MVRRDAPSLDELAYSPITSPTAGPGSSLLDSIPGSALAERIFNDPEAWEILGDDDGASSALPLDEQEVEAEMSWLENEIKHFNMPSTPMSVRYLRDGPALPDEDVTIPPSPDPLHLNIQPSIGEQELITPESIQPDKYRSTPKPGSISVFPTYVHDPPGGLSAPRHEGYLKDIPGLDHDEIRPISLANLFTSDNATHGHFGADLHVHFAHILGSGGGQAINGASHHLPHILSPPSSDASSSPTSSSGCNCHPSLFNPPSLPLGISNMHPTSASTLSVPASAASTMGSPFKVYSASTTMSFLEWHGIYSPAVKTAGVDNAPSSGDGVSAPSSATVRWHPPPKSYLTQTVITDHVGDGHRAEYCNTPDVTENQTDTSFIPHTITAPSSEESNENTIAHEPPVQPITPRKPKISKRTGIIFSSSPRGRSMSPRLIPRNSPKPPPTIPLPDIPTANSPPPPPVPPKSNTNNDQTNNRIKTPIRRLPSIPNTATTTTTEGHAIIFTARSEPTPASSSIAYTPPPPPPYTSTSTTTSTTTSTRINTYASRRPSAINTSAIKTPRTSGRCVRFTPHDTTTSGTATATNTTPSDLNGNGNGSASLMTPRSPPPCPAGPRQRMGSSNNTTPVRSAWYTNPHTAGIRTARSVGGCAYAHVHAHGKGSGGCASPATPVVTVSRSVSAPRSVGVGVGVGVVRHGYSRSE